MASIEEQMREQIQAVKSAEEGAPVRPNDNDDTGSSGGSQDTREGNREASENRQDTDSDSGHSDADQSGHTLSEVAQQARGDGWRPKEEWQGNTEDWVSAKEFNRAKSLFSKIDHEVKARKAMERQLDELRDSFDSRITNVARVAREQAITELNAQKKDAVEDADYERVQEIDKQIAETDSQFAEPAPEPQVALKAPVQQFIESNDWFNTDPQMSQFAISYQQALLSNVSNDPNQITDAQLAGSLKETLGAVKRAFPDKFGESVTNGQTNGDQDPSARRQPKAAAVEGGAPVSKQRKRFGPSNLTAEESHVMEQMKFYAGMEEDDYVQAIADIENVGRGSRRTTKTPPYKNRSKRT